MGLRDSGGRGGARPQQSPCHRVPADGLRGRGGHRPAGTQVALQGALGAAPSTQTSVSPRPCMQQAWDLMATMGKVWMRVWIHCRRWLLSPDACPVSKHQTEGAAAEHQVMCCRVAGRWSTGRRLVAAAGVLCGRQPSRDGRTRCVTSAITSLGDRRPWSGDAPRGRCNCSAFCMHTAGCNV